MRLRNWLSIQLFNLSLYKKAQFFGFFCTFFLDESLFNGSEGSLKKLDNYIAFKILRDNSKEEENV